MTEIRAAFDASKECPAGITTVAGYIADPAQWHSVEGLWNKQLALAGLAEFHLSEIRKSYPNGGWLDVVRPFAQIISDAKLRSITAILNDSDWSQLEHDRDYRRVCPHREHACLDMLFGVLAEDARLEFASDQVTVILDYDYGNTKSAAKVHKAWCDRMGHPGFNLSFKGDVSWDSVPLQCADLVAGLLRLDPFSRARLDDRLGAVMDDNSMVEIASSALNNGRGAMWSAAIAVKVEELLLRQRSKNTD